MFDFLKRLKPPKPVAKPAPYKAAGFTLEVSLQTDVGCHRELNEDAGRVVHDPGSGSVLVAVADGMGGHEAGEVASRKAIDIVSKAYRNGASKDPHVDLKNAFLAANQEIFEHAKRSPQMQGMGTTCTAFAMVNGSGYAVHVGDSRLYMVRNGEIYLMTEDHSAVMELVKLGTLTLEEARHHTDKNVILRALGSKPEVEVSVWPEPLPLKEGDRFVVCSDGLYDRIEDKEIRDIAVSGKASDACVALIGLAKERGGFDNITVAVVHLALVANASKAAAATRELEAQT